MKKLIMLLALAILLAATALFAQQSGQADDQQANAAASNDRPIDEAAISAIPHVAPGATSESSESTPPANN